MITNTLARKVVLVEYSLLRTPLDLLDRQVAARSFAGDSSVRLVLGRGLDVLDAAAAHLLGSGASTPPEAAVPEPGATDGAEVDVADDAGAEPADAVAEVEVVPVEEVERVAEELLEERAETPLTGELAEVDEDGAVAMAELRAKHIVEEYEAQQRESRGEPS